MTTVNEASCDLPEDSAEVSPAELREAMGLNFRIEVDGGIAHDTVASVVQAGAEMLVAGSAVFEDGRTEHNAAELLRIARAAASAE